MSLRPAHEVVDATIRPATGYAERLTIIEQDRADTRADLIEKVKAAVDKTMCAWTFGHGVDKRDFKACEMSRALKAIDAVAKESTP